MAMFKGLYGGKNKLFGDYQLPEATPPAPIVPWAQPTPDLNANMPPVLADEAKPSAFGKNGKAWQILGIIGDAMQTWGGGQGTYVPAMLDLQQRTDAERRQLEMYKQRRQDERDDFLWKQQHTPPDIPPIVRDARAFAAMTPEERQNYQTLEDMRNPVIRQGSDGIPRPMARPPAIGSVVQAPWLQGGEAPTATAPFQPGVLDAVTAETESGNRNYVYSPKGAMHAMQVMPGTARDPGFGVSPARSNDPNEINRVGRDYRAAMQQRYGGDLAKMWAAYNWGPGNLDSALARHGEGWLSAAPAETQNYIRRNFGKLRSR